MKEIFFLHIILKVIISDRDPKFTRNFWKSLFKGLDTKLNYYLSSANEWTNRKSKSSSRRYVTDVC